MDAIDRALLDCLRGGPGAPPRHEAPDLSRAGWDLFVRRARTQHVVPLIYRRLRTAAAGSVPPDVLASLHRRVRRVALRNAGLFSELRAVALSFRQAEIPLMLLKGALLAPDVYGDASLREMSDLDLLVRRDDLAPALRHLLDLGFRPREELPDDVADRLTRFHHVPPLSRGRGPIELHWTLLAPDRAPATPLEEIWERAEPVVLAGAEALAPSLEDLLLHTCAHAAYNHAFEAGLRPYCDIRHILEKRGREIRWPLLLDRSRAWGWDPGVLLALLLSHRLTASAVPRAVLDQAAAAVPPQLVRDAEEMALCDPRDTNRMSPNLAEWHHRPTLRNGLGLFWTRLRWRPDHVDPSPGYYARRGLSLLRRHLPVVFRLSAGDRGTDRLATRKRRLGQWLAPAHLAGGAAEEAARGQPQARCGARRRTG